jgi:peptidoglycan L-alanyl-D-glutamate endopeptidase CwlK
MRKIFKFSESSEQYLNTVVLELTKIAHRVLEISPIDFAITSGFRSRGEQEKLYRDGKSRTLDSKHCQSKAIDFVPCHNGLQDFSAVEDCLIIAGLFYGVAASLGYKLRLGAIWDNSGYNDNKFVDVYHVELL